MMELNRRHGLADPMAKRLLTSLDAVSSILYRVNVEPLSITLGERLPLCACTYSVARTTPKKLYCDWSGDNRT